MKIKVLSFLLIAIFALSACSPAKSAQVDSMEYGMPVEAPAAVAPEMSRDLYMEETTANVAGQGEVSQAEVVRLVIRNADLSIVVDEPNDAMGYISQMAERMGGYVVSSNLWKSMNYNGMEIPEASINVRVPSNLLIRQLMKLKI